jgi:hypothetical protein
MGLWSRAHLTQIRELEPLRNSRASLNPLATEKTQVRGNFEGIGWIPPANERNSSSLQFYTWMGVFYDRVVRLEMPPKRLDHLGFQL